MKGKTNSLTPINNFPIWEKIYIDSNKLEENNFFENVKGVHIKNLVYIFSSKHIHNNKTFYIFDLDNETLKEEEAGIQDCFQPVYDGKNSIYLFKIDNSYSSDFRYHLIDFNVKNKTWTTIAHKGVSPKKRSDDFSVVYHQNSNKIFFFGGMQIFPGDNTGSFVYSFSLDEYEWNIETVSGEFLNKSQIPYVSNKSGITPIFYNQDKILLLGGKILEHNFSNSFNSSNVENLNFILNQNYTKENKNTFFTEIETDEIFEFNMHSKQFTKRQYTKLLDDVKFNNYSVCHFKDCVIIHNKGSFYYYDFISNDLSQLKPLLFSPEAISQSILLIYNGYLYILGRFKYYEDAIIFKTSMENLSPKWNYTKEISYEMLLNNKYYSDIVFVLNAGDKNREIHVNKKVMYNFSFPLKNIIINGSQNSNYYNFTDGSFIGVYNTLKFIYSNFNDNLNSLDLEIINEMIDIIVKYRAKSLLNIVLSQIKITPENVFFLFELAIRNELNDFKSLIYNYICNNLNPEIFAKEKNINDSYELKKLLFENYFCKHPLVVEVNTLGYDVKNISQNVTISPEKLKETQEICKNNKLSFCVFCKKIIN